MKPPAANPTSPRVAGSVAPRLANRSRSRARWVGLGLGILVVLVTGMWLASRLNRARPPEPDLTHASPAVRRTVERHLEDVRRHPRSSTAWGQLGSVLYAYRRMPEARLALAEAERRDPANPRWPYLRGLILATDDPARALDCLRQAVARCGNTPPAPRLRLARWLAEQGQWEDAAREAEAVLVAHPGEPDALLLAAQAAQRCGDLARALTCAREAAAAPATARQALALLASLLHRQGDLAGASEAAQRAATAPSAGLPSDPYEAEALALREDPNTFSERVHPLLARGRLEEAAAVVRRMTEDYPEFPDSWLAAGRLEFLRKNLAGAEAHLRQHLTLDPPSVQGWFQLGLVLLSAHREAEAIDAFAKAIASKPDFGPAWFNRGLALGRLGRREEAMAAFQQTLRHSPEHLETYLLYADLHLQLRQRAPALALIEQAALLDPNDRRLSALRQKAASISGP